AKASARGRLSDTERVKLTRALVLYGEDWEEVIRHAKSRRPLSELKAYYAAHLVEEVARGKAQLDLCSGEESHGEELSSPPQSGKHHGRDGDDNGDRDKNSNSSNRTAPVSTPASRRAGLGGDIGGH